MIEYWILILLFFIMGKTFLNFSLYNAKAVSMMNRRDLILYHAQLLREMYHQMKKAWDIEPHGLSHRAACAMLWRKYDLFAFPGGLEQARKAFKNKSQNIIGLSIEYLDANPNCYRSGYIKEEVLRYLKRVRLESSHQDQLYDLMLRSLHHDPRRVFRAYAKLFPVIQKASFILSIQALSESPDARVRERAAYVLHCWRSFPSS